jgi:esterase/lipase superfamily enzyme
VYFATNRVITDAADAAHGYTAALRAPSDPAAVSYGSAFVDGVDVASNAQGRVSQVNDIAAGGFPAQAAADIAQAGRDLLLFIHGFDNTFADALTRAAFNRQWLAESQAPGADTTVIAFCWPSQGRIVDFPAPQGAYLADQHMARNSGLHLMAFFTALQPLLATARAAGRRVTVLAHSMGNLALQAAVENWFLHGNGDVALFDRAVLAAGDCAFDAFDQPDRARLSGLDRLARRVAVYYSHADDVLKISMVVNLGAQRLGQDGPRHRTDAAAFPPAIYTMVDCTGFRDYDFNFLSSHQYYRQSPGVRAIIAADMAS